MRRGPYQTPSVRWGWLARLIPRQVYLHHEHFRFSSVILSLCVLWVARRLTLLSSSAIVVVYIEKIMHLQAAYALRISYAYRIAHFINISKRDRDTNYAPPPILRSHVRILPRAEAPGNYAHARVAAVHVQTIPSPPAVVAVVGGGGLFFMKADRVTSYSTESCFSKIIERLGIKPFLS